MARFMTKMLEYLGVEETPIDEENMSELDYGAENEDEFEENDKVVRMSSRQAKRPIAPAPRDNVVPMSQTSRMKMIVYHPISYEDTQNIIDNLKSRKPVIVNMEELEIPCAQRILDFMAGAIYALSGTIYKISSGIFIVAPTNYDVIGSGDDPVDSRLV